MPAKMTVAVGGVVVKDQQALLVRRSAAGREGDWQIPGGFVDPGESLATSVRREVLEETGVDGTITGLLAVLNRVSEAENNTYLIFLLSSEQTFTAPDGQEVDAARFFSLGELSSLPRLQSLSELLARYALSSQAVVFPTYRHPRIPIEFGRPVRRGKRRRPFRRPFPSPLVRIAYPGARGGVLLAWLETSDQGTTRDERIDDPPRPRLTFAGFWGPASYPPAGLAYN